MTTKPHVAEAERIQREIKRSALSRQHPDWSEEKVFARVRRIFTTSYL